MTIDDRVNYLTKFREFQKNAVFKACVYFFAGITVGAASISPFIYYKGFYDGAEVDRKRSNEQFVQGNEWMRQNNVRRMFDIISIEEKMKKEKSQEERIGRDKYNHSEHIIEL